MKIIVDDKIPFIKEAIEKIADEVVYAPGKDFTPSLVKDADALIIRTRTRCNLNCWKVARLSLSLRQPSASTISMRNTAAKPVLHGQMLPAAIPPP